MKPLSMKAKTAYYAKVRSANYIQSLRLEGFDVGQKGDGKASVSHATPKKQRQTQA